MSNPEDKDKRSTRLHKEEAAIKFADINAGGGRSSHRDSALKASENFEVVA